jgi:hypothetical protein
VAERGAAVKAVTARVTLARDALERANIEKRLRAVADARTIILKAEAEKAAAEKTRQQKATAAEKASTAAKQAKLSAAKAAAECAAAKAALENATDAAKPSLVLCPD